MPEFSSNESVSLEKNIESIRKIVETNPDDIDNVYEITKCSQWIQSNNLQKVCLQFPDHLLPDSTEVALKLQSTLKKTVYVLGDTAYESCCIDYVAASHVNADGIIHFGPTCFSKTSAEIPYLNIYEKHPIDIEKLENCFSQEFSDLQRDFIVLLDTEYIHRFDDISSRFGNYENVQVRQIDDETLHLTHGNIIFVGNNSRKLMNIDLSFKPEILYSFDPEQESPQILTFKIDPKVLKRRYFLTEKIRDAQSIGIVIGTLAVKNYLKIIERVKKLVELSHKKYYIISVGKPTVAKLANFAEIDVYVMITCSMNEIYDSREFYKPVVTPFDIEISLNTNISDLQFSYDYNRYFNKLEDLNTLETNANETDVSLLTGKLRSNIPLQENLNDSISDEVALRPDGAVALNTHFGAGFLNERSWKGLEQNLGQTEVKLAEDGRKGIAQAYDNEQLTN